MEDLDLFNRKYAEGLIAALFHYLDVRGNPARLEEYNLVLTLHWRRPKAGEDMAATLDQRFDIRNVMLVRPEEVPNAEGFHETFPRGETPNELPRGVLPGSLRVKIAICVEIDERDEPVMDGGNLTRSIHVAWNLCVPIVHLEGFPTGWLARKWREVPLWTCVDYFMKTRQDNLQGGRKKTRRAQ